MNKPKDLSSEEGAKYLAHKIRMYWLKRGIKIQTNIEHFGDHGEKPFYCVRSDLGKLLAQPKHWFE